VNSRSHPAGSPGGISDEELASQARAGSSSAFSSLVERHGPALLRVLESHTDCRQDAEDLVQETFLKASRNLDRYDSTRPFGAWLFTIGTRLAASHRRGRHATTSLGESDPADPGSDPHRLAADAETVSDLWRVCRRELSPRQYQVLWLRYSRELPVKDIARQMHMTQIHVKVILHRIRKKLIAMGAGGAAAAGHDIAKPRSGAAPETGKEI
jgi:RNA polymerase sigma-70 factor (ECF subfamily)